MCSATFIFILCAGVVINVYSRDVGVTRLTSNDDFDKWLWGSFEDNYPIKYQNPQTDFSFEVNPEVKLTATSGNSDVKLDLLNLPPKEKRRKDTPKIVTTKATDAPFTSKSETNPFDLSTASATQINPIDLPFTTTTEIVSTEFSSTTMDTKLTNLSKTSDGPSSSTPEIKPNSFPTTSETQNILKDESISSTIEQFNNSTSTPVAELRLLNSSDASSPEENNDENLETTTEVNTIETTSVSPETTTANYCDPLPGKPDFSAPGRRLNEEKCMGYVWELRNRITIYEQDLICKKKPFVNHAVGGRNTEVGEFPHMGALGWKATVGTWVFKCGSSLISPNFVLTAAHCTKASPSDSSIVDPVPKIVRLGDKRIADKEDFFTFPTDANISKIIVHPQYKPPMKYNDIALMELAEPVEFTRLIQPACLWNSYLTGDPGHEATLTGWGVVESGSLKNSPELQAATVDVLDNNQCDGLLQNSHNRNWKGFHENQLCAGKLAGGVDSCQGDSGGPLQMKMDLSDSETERQGQMHYVIGVISFGVGCAHKNLPGVYTRVSSFIEWIEDNVWKNGNERLFVPPPESDFSDFSLAFV